MPWNQATTTAKAGGIQRLLADAEAAGQNAQRTLNTIVFPLNTTVFPLNYVIPLNARAGTFDRSSSYLRPRACTRTQPARAREDFIPPELVVVHQGDA
jgi:hypothetical protein